MSKRTEDACALRSIKEPHYNCCHATFMVFSDLHGVDADTAYSLGHHFGGGMRVGTVCGALSGAIMTMGMLRHSNDEVKALIAEFEQTHGSIYCAALLEKINDELPKDVLCNRLICHCVEILERYVEFQKHSS